MKKVLLFVIAALCLVACGEKPGDAQLTGATLSRTTLELTEGATYRLVVNPIPEDAEIASVTWSSSDEMVASVAANGTVSANSVGTATISAAIEGTDIVAKCNVTVKSLLEATVYDQVFIWNTGKDNPYQISMKKNDGSDTVITAITALLAMFPSTMYVDGEGYMAGDGGYVLFLNTAFMINETSKAWYCLADYSVVENALNNEGRVRPWTIQAAKFDAENYAAYWTQYILWTNERADEPKRDDFPYYDPQDSYFYRAFVAEDGIALLEGGYLVLKEGAECFVSTDNHKTDDRCMAPTAYNLDAKLFGNPNNLGFAIEERVDEETGETSYVFVDNNEDNLFDLAEMIDFNFNGGLTEEAQAAPSALENARALPEKVCLKNISINRTLHAFMLVNANI
jgi:hypothetical protein